MKKAVITTFPINYYDLCARDMLVSFDKYWPKDVEIFIQLDCISQEELASIQEDLNAHLVSGREFYISNEWSYEQREFYQRNTDSGDNYRFHVCKFSHKVFALKTASDHCKQIGIDCLIWLDADVITHKPVTHEILEKELLPIDNQDVSFLGRKDAPHSECGFVGYDLAIGGQEIINHMHDYYLTDKVLQLPGWTDCDVFDDVLRNSSGYIRNLSLGIDGWHVWPDSPLGKYMEHRKGNRKFNDGNKPKILKDKVIDANDMKIKTKNCLPNDNIQANIKENLKLIKHWVGYVKPHYEEVVVCSAGDSLSYSDIKKWHDGGVKIITVKHAIDRLKAWGIKPWACILLDPRPHVENFVKRPDPDVIYFVASMVDPGAVKSLLDAGCHVVGYHAYVGAGESQLLPHGTMMVSGGSATATRCIGLLHECLGFSNFHCYGYDLCHYDKPDPSIKNDDGSQKYMEVTLSAQTWGGKHHKRTFWTEGQLLAQAQELHDLYKVDQSFRLYIHGHGLAAWQHSHWKQYKAWLETHNTKIDDIKNNSLSLSEWEYGITGRTTTRNYGNIGTEWDATAGLTGTSTAANQATRRDKYC